MFKNKFFQLKKQKGISLIITLLIISSVLTATLIVSETAIRQGQVVYGAEISEKGYFAAKTATEIAAYDVLEDYQDISSYSLSESFSGGSQYEASVSTDTLCPDSGCVDTEAPISNGNPWSINLEAGESFDLDLDINGASYPASLIVSQAGSESTDLIVYYCEIDAETRACSTTKTQVFYTSFPQTINFDGANYYWIRINNNGSSTETYTLTPSIDNDLPIGVEINAIGKYEEYQREINQNIPKWQKYGI